MQTTKENNFYYSDVEIVWSSHLSPRRLQLSRGFIVSQQPAGYPSQRPAEAGTRPAGLCIRTTDAAGLPFASILILVLSTSPSD